MRPVPHQPTDRVRKITNRTKDDARKSQDVQLQAMPALSCETAKDRLERLKAYKSCWDSLSSHLEHILEHANKGTFKELESFVRMHHSSPSKRRSTSVGYQRLLPAALTVAGGVNSSDHARTFPDLVSQLRSQGCYAALVQPRDLSANSTVGTALNSILRQFSELDTEASDFEALHAWYDDQVQEPEEEAAAPNAGSAAKRQRAGTTVGGYGPPNRGARSGVQTRAAYTELVPDSESEATCGQDCGEGRADSSQSACSDGEQDKTSQAMPVEERAREQTASLAASERPLVVVIENTEAADMLSLQDLILVLSEGRARLPVTLVLGMAISVAALRHMLPAKAADVLQAKEFRLVQAKQLLESLVREALLGRQFHGVMFDYATLDFLLERFLNHDFNVASFRRGLQVACMTHFQTNPLSALAAAAGRGTAALRAAVTALPEALRGQGRSGGTFSSGAAPSLAEEVEQTLHAWSAWAVALCWINAAARAVGMGNAAGLDDLSLHKLYVGASQPGYMEGAGAGLRRLQALCDKLERLSAQQARHLLDSFQECAAAVWRGSEAFASELRTVQELAREVDEGAAAASREGPSGSQQEETPGTAVPATPVPRLASRRDSLTLSTMLKQQKAPLGIAQRRQSLFNIGTDAEGKGLAALEAVHSRGLGVRATPSLACRVAGLLQAAAKQHLATPPSTLPGARGLCCRSSEGVQSMLAATPRWAVHLALAEREPSDYCAAGDPDAAQQLGVLPSMEDAAIAYRLLLEYGESVPVADWFGGFCAVFEAHACDDGAAEEEENFAPTKKRRGRPPKAHPTQASITKYMPNQPTKEFGGEAHEAPRRGRPRKVVGAESDAAKTPEISRGRGKGAARKAKQAAAAAASRDDMLNDAVAPPSSAAVEPAEQAAVGAEGHKVPVQELAVRFNCAMQDLQLLGFIKEAGRRRRDNCVQRLVFPMRR
ncbi:g2380 [Coccomyxa elongata]